MASIREHYNHLELHNPKEWEELNVELVRANQYDHFKRSVLKHDGYNLSKIRGPIETILKKYLPFEDWHFTTNTLPELCHADKGSISNQIPA